jgi:hypothetical protein
VSKGRHTYNEFGSKVEFWARVLQQCSSRLVAADELVYPSAFAIDLHLGRACISTLALLYYLASGKLKLWNAVQNLPPDLHITYKTKTCQIFYSQRHSKSCRSYIRIKACFDKF